MNKKIIRVAGKFTLSFLSSIALYFFIAYVFSHITVNSDTENKKEVAIYIMSNGIHTDLVLPAQTAIKDWTKEIKYSNTITADSSYIFLAFGWGDKKFYLETPEFSDLKISTALLAISALGSSAMHTTYYQNITEDKHCKKVLMSKAQYQKLCEYISNCFILDGSGHFVKINTPIHYDNGDAFYQAKGSYSIFKTCNTWTNNALKFSGQKCCLWTIFDTPILAKYERD